MKYQDSQPRPKTLRRFALQVSLGMSRFRKEIIDTQHKECFDKESGKRVACKGIIRHPTKARIYGYVAMDNKMVYVR